MNRYVLDFLFVLFFMAPILFGIMGGFKVNNFIKVIKGIEESICFVISFILSLNLLSKNFSNYVDWIQRVSPKLGSLSSDNPRIAYYVFLLISIFIIYYGCLIPFAIINSLIIDPLMNKVESLWDRSGKGIKIFISGLFKVPQGILIILVFAVIIHGAVIFRTNKNLSTYINNSTIYKVFNDTMVEPFYRSNFAKSLPIIIDNSLKVNVVSEKQPNSPSNDTKRVVQEVVYYNGVTLEDGVKGSNEINRTSIELNKKKTTDREKAKAIYSWVGSNIEYDYAKAQDILSDDFNSKSGAIEAFKKRSGVCFDFSCLYVAMARANNLKVRMVIGKGFDGSEWVSHAWNEVYLKEEDKWITVDSTFYKGGNYFDSKNFYYDHEKEKVIGEW